MQQVQVVFESNSEVTVKDLPLLKCHVIEPTLGEGKDTIASIPIKLSVSIACFTIELTCKKFLRKKKEIMVTILLDTSEYR